MSATQVDMKFSAVVEKPENQPPWLVALSESTGRTCDELVKIMLEAEMYSTGLKFIADHPGLFRGTLA